MSVLINVKSLRMFNEVCRRNILELAAVYGHATYTAPTMVSMKFYGNGTFFRDLEQRKRSISVERFGTMLAAFAKNWPENTPWPDLAPIYFTPGNLLQQRYVTNRGKTRHAPKER